MKRVTMKRIITGVLGACLCFVTSMSCFAEELNPVNIDVAVEIVSPQKIDSVPIYSDEIKVRVTNQSEKTIKNIDCYLSVVDRDRKQSFPMDEFGADSYQTREITDLAARESRELIFPIRVMYVGNFRMVVNAVNYDTDNVYTSNALTVIMTSTSNLNKSLVVSVSVIMPIMMMLLTFVLMRKRGARKNPA